MKYIHIMKTEMYKYNQLYINFINKYFDSDEHLFVLIGIEDEFKKYNSAKNNMEFIEGLVSLGEPLKFFKGFRCLIGKINCSDGVIWHSLFENYWMLGLISFSQKIMDKSFWIVWGADLYNWKKFKSPNKAGALNTIKNRGYYSFVRKLRNILVGFKPDAKSVKEIFKYDNEVLPGKYPLGYDLKMIEECRPAERNNNALNIMVGHSATQKLNHKKVLELLKPYSNNNINVIIPLNYGNKEYGDLIQNIANEMYPAHNYCIRHSMDIGEYISLLKSVDIAIFDSERQIALGNILLLLYLNKKLYLDSSGVMYNYFKSHDVDAGTIQDIGKIPFEDLCLNNSSSSSRAIAESWMNEDELYKEWSSTFSKIKESLRKETK